MKVVLGFWLVVIFLILIAILGKKLLDSILSFIDVLRKRRSKKSSDEKKEQGADSSKDSEKEVR